MSKRTVEEMQNQLGAWGKLYGQLNQLDNVELLNKIERGEDWVQENRHHPDFNKYLQALSMMQNIYSERMEKDIKEAMK